MSSETGGEKMVMVQAPRVWLMAAGFGVPGGIEAHVLHYAVEMRRRGWSPQVVIFFDFPIPSHRFMDALDAEDIPKVSLRGIARTRIRFRYFTRLLPWCIWQLIKKRRVQPADLWTWICTQEQIGVLHQLLTTAPPDVIHVFGRLPHLAWSALPAEKTIFHQMMTGDIDGVWTDTEIHGFVDFTNRCAAFLVPGEGVAANLRRFFHVKGPMTPVFTLCPDVVGVDESHKLIRTRSTRQVREKNLRFGVVCRLTEQKGISYLLDALVEYASRHDGVNFAFAGVGDLESMIRMFITKHDLKNVTIEKVVDPVKFLSGIDVFVHPSIGDAMPMAIAEALMCGVPCIVSNVGGCPDLVRDGQEGFVIEPHWPDEILERMEQFAAMSADERAEFALRARERYESVCMPEAVGDVVEKHYRAIVARG